MKYRIVFSTRVGEDYIRALKHLAVDLKRALGELIEEGIDELLKKYNSTRYLEDSTYTYKGKKPDDNNSKG